MRANPITIEALEILDAIDRRGSFAKAAEELNKATSALSYGVQKLEEQLDITVFHRQGRRSVLTPAGRLLLEEGRKIIHSTTQLAEKAKEVATGWEPRLNIAVESIVNYSRFFQALTGFLNHHQTLEVDVCECVLNGGWEALEQDRVDLIVGVPGPVPLQKGYRAVPMILSNMVPVIASHHPLAKIANDSEALNAALPELRRVVTHDTTTVNVARSAGLSIGKQLLYVQTMEQKVEAQLAGLGVGHLPRHRIQEYLDDGRLIELNLATSKGENFIAWKISNKGKALQAFSQQLAQVKW
ncbi:MAG: LysR family transcriptional regulator [Moraxellaceae bacterium]|nr:MAG: LysR family transcriptional regulator [Moraxellaceae bacterium]